MQRKNGATFYLVVCNSASLWLWRASRALHPGRSLAVVGSRGTDMVAGECRKYLGMREMRAKGVTDADLYEVLSVVEIASIVDRPGGWESQPLIGPRRDRRQ
jgi:hypothetical protein